MRRPDSSRSNQPNETSAPQSDSTEQSTARYFYPRRKLAEPIHIQTESGDEITIYSVPLNPLPPRKPITQPGPNNSEPNDQGSDQSKDQSQSSPPPPAKLHWSKAWKATQTENPHTKIQSQLPYWQPTSAPTESPSSLDRLGLIHDN